MPQVVFRLGVIAPCELGDVVQCTSSEIVELSVASADAIVHDIHEPWRERAVSIQWLERPAHACDLVEYADAFKLLVDVANGSVLSCELCVDEAAFLAQVATGVRGELAIISVISQMWRSAHMHQRCPALPTAHEAQQFTWPGTDVEPHAHQRASLAWMQCVEHEITTKTPLSYTKEIRVGTSTWYVDQYREVLTQTATHVPFHCRGGILCDGTGMGKTATVLALIAASSVPPATTNPYASKATLLVVPINLPDQWCDEIARYIGADIKLRRLLRKRDLDDVSMSDLLDADIVLTTVAFLRNSRPYQSCIEREARRLGTYDPKELRHARLFRCLARLHGLVEPVVECVQWRRVVVDEVHELISSTRDWRYITSLPTDILWGITATPELRDHRAHGLYGLLQNAEHHPLHHPNLLAAIVSHRVRGTVTAPLVSTDVHHVPMNPSERELFDQTGRARMPLAETIERLSSGTSSYPYDMLASNIACDPLHLERSLQRAIGTTECAMPIRPWMRAASQALVTQSHTCQICMERTSDSITACGHLYCAECLHRALHATGDRCPMCRMLLAREDTWVFLPNRVPSKVARLNQLLCGARGHTIVFSQWMHTLRTLRALLRSSSTPAYMLEGTVQHRSNTLRAFTESGGVLLVCLAGSFAGLHLPQVSTVIFAHALVESRTAIETIETQALARALRFGNKHNVRVMTLVAPDCDEERLWQCTRHPQTMSGLHARGLGGTT